MAPSVADGGKPRIAVFSGPTATIQNAAPLVTSQKARLAHGLPPLRDGRDRVPIVDALRPQRLAAPAVVYVEQFSAHPLERDAEPESAAPDGYVGADGAFRKFPRSNEDVPAYRVELRPEDGLYPLPFMGRRADGRPWEPPARDIGEELTRQTFFPDASRLYEEIDRFAVDDDGLAGVLSRRAEFDFYRAVPSGGFRRGVAEGARTDVGRGDLPPETVGVDFFPYAPAHVRADPPQRWLAVAANVVQSALDTGRYAGAQWLEGTPTIDETLYWLGLLVDTTVPIVGHASQRPASARAFDGAQNILDGVSYITSGCSLDGSGVDRVGPVLVVDGLAYPARDVAKLAARPGGYTVTGGLGGAVADVTDPPSVAFVPQRLATSRSETRLSLLPRVARRRGRRLAPDGLPRVEIFAFTRFASPDQAARAFAASVDEAIASAAPLGVVYQGLTPSGTPPRLTERELERAALRGVPVVLCGRGHPGGRVRHANPLLVRGDNLTAPKARLLLIAALLKLGPLPAAVDADAPSEDDRAVCADAVLAYQQIFDTH